MESYPTLGRTDENGVIPGNIIIGLANFEDIRFVPRLTFLTFLD